MEMSSNYILTRYFLKSTLIYTVFRHVIPLYAPFEANSLRAVPHLLAVLRHRKQNTVADTTFLQIPPVCAGGFVGHGVELGAQVQRQALGALAL